MPLSFRLFSAGFSFVCFGMGLYALASGILGKKIKSVPCLIYTVYYLLANALIYAVIAVLEVTMGIYQYVNMINLLNGTLGNLLHAVVLALVLRRCLGTDFWQGLNWVYPDTTPGIGYNIFFFALIVVALFWVQFLAMYAAGQDKIRAQEETIAQHQAHMALLEELQQEIRAFRHDFTNLFSGLTLQAQEGDLEGIQDFMKKTSSYFDEKLGQEIQQMDGLNNIGLYPLRSLLTTKLADMRKKGIHSALEVLYPVDTKIVMETEDLLRGLGILLDNAMEAVPQTDGTVRIVLLQEEKELYIAVSNNYEKKPELSALSQKGYTTKGTGRGTGLTSYRRIVSRCKGCITRTYLKDGYFVQELRLPAA